MITFILSTILTFIATEIDDFAVYIVLYAEKKEHKFSIFCGQLFIILLISLLCGFVSIPLSKIPLKYLRFIGIIPIGLGIFSIFENEEKQKTTNISSIFLTSAILTLAASADNIGIYIPFFTSLSITRKIISIIIFILLQCILSFLQIKTAKIPVIQNFVEKSKRILVPAVFIILGVLIIFDLL